MHHTTPVPAVPADEALRLSRDGARLVDVREPYEWEAGHAPTARHVPLTAFDLSAVPAGDGPVLVICRSGNRSQAATMALRSNGLDAFNVTGGMQAWAQLGGEVVTSAGAPGQVA